VLFRSWRAGSLFNPEAVDRFCEQLRANGTTLPVLYFCEWVDRWLMGDLVPGPGALEGRRYQATCLTPNQAREWANRCGEQCDEEQWLATRLREAALAWEGVANGCAVLGLREVLGGSTLDEEVLASLRGVPDWLLGIEAQGEST